MRLVFDPEKDARNSEIRGLPCLAVASLDFEAALIVEDDRQDYGETRFIALGPIGHRLHVVVYLRIDGGIRVIGLRKANAREGGGMAKNPDAERIDAENPEWTDEMFARAVRFGDLPKDHQRTLRGVGRPKKADAKVLISLRVKPSLAEAYKAKGKGWRLEIEKVLAKALIE